MSTTTEEQPHHHRTEPSGLVNFIAGGVGGVFQVFSGHPLDTMKVRMVSSPEQYAGMGDCFRKTISTEGVGGLYKGVGSPLIGFTALNAVLFASFGAAQNFVRGDVPIDDELPLSKIFVSGAIAGVCVSSVECPVDLFKTKMQTQPSPPIYKGVFHAGSVIAKTYGIRGIYQGVVPTLIRNTPANAFYFTMYEWSKRTLRNGDQPLSPLKTLLAGGIGGMSYWVTCYPLDAVKSIMQADHIDPAKRKYSGYVDCVKKVSSEFGIKGFFRGFLPCFLRSFPANAFCFLGYELTIKALA